ncbi:dihydrolipoamide acetyltransferase family protein [Pedobacter sp. P351]|uniref:dihydrolipoamide acetyltransferase family protein n=1 Tax=Pedobacter superstes TaxID=3133441 RepID=UPI0030B12D5D
MAQFELILPKMGESVAEATIVKWLKQPGEQIKEDETVVEIATDKVDSEVPSPVSGKFIKYLFKENEIASVGDVIALIEIEDLSIPKAATNKPAEAPKQTVEVIPENSKDFIETIIPGIEHLNEQQFQQQTIIQSNTSRFYSPLVRSIAAEEGLTSEELEKISGSGADGRVTKQDILEYVAQRSSGRIKKAVPLVENQSISPVSVNVVSGNDEIIEMDRMRKLISEHMMMSLQTAAHVTSFVESDVTNLVKWREKNKAAFEKKIGEKITYTPIFIQAVAKAIRDFPMINISLNGTQIIKKNDINIGLAAALPSGNLIVPVIKKADQLNLVGLTKAVNDLAVRSRNNKLQPDEVKDGTFTITNIGSFGNIMGTPIINQPQVAILAIGAIQKKPAVIETVHGDMIGIRHKMYLSLSYDHRIVDGALGGMFLKKISDYLEAWDINYEI